MPTPLAWLVHSVWVMAHWLFNVHGVYCCRLVCFDACDHMTLVDVPPRGVQLVQAAMQPLQNPSNFGGAAGSSSLAMC